METTSSLCCFLTCSRSHSPINVMKLFNLLTIEPGLFSTIKNLFSLIPPWDHLSSSMCRLLCCWTNCWFKQIIFQSCQVWKNFLTPTRQRIQMSNDEHKRLQRRMMKKYRHCVGEWWLDSCGKISGSAEVDAVEVLSLSNFWRNKDDELHRCAINTRFTWVDVPFEPEYLQNITKKWYLSFK